MEIVDCFWEIDNLGKKTVELDFEQTEEYVSNEVQQATKGYEYLVAKVPTGNISCLLGLQNDGFVLMETQMSISKNAADFRFDDKMVRFVDKRVSFRQITNDGELQSVLTAIDNNMFSTDRIYLDEQLGAELSLKRYRNWISTEFEKGTVLYESEFKGERIGFGLFRLNEGIMNVLLGGVYHKYQNFGLGILTACSPFLFCKAQNINVSKEITAVSSNNFPVVQFYNYLDFKIDKMSYVLVKHQKAGA